MMKIDQTRWDFFSIERMWALRNSSGHTLVTLECLPGFTNGDLNASKEKLQKLGWLKIHANVWVSKFRTSIVCVISHSSESVWVIKSSFCQNDPPMGGLFWQKDSLITHILSELRLITHTILVRNLLTHTLPVLLILILLLQY